MRLTLSLTALSSELDFENLENAMGYVGSEIAHYRIDRTARILEVDLGEHTETALVEEKLTALLRKLKPLRAQGSAAVLVDRSTETVPFHEDMLRLLVERRDIVFHGPGICSLHGKFRRMFQALDDRLLAFARTHRAEEAHYPITIGISTLRRSNFFSQYPHFATFQSTLRAGADNISAAAKKLASSDEVDCREYLNSPAAMCRSAVCLHAYPSFAGEVFPLGKTVCVTTMGRVFRQEGRNVSGLERLHEYSVRDIIYFGSPDYVIERLRACNDWCVAYLQKYRLRGVIQPANDSFFTDNLAALQFFQRAEATKFEFRLINPFTGTSISVASVNDHGDHFSKAYNIKFDDGTFVRTGCFGVGYERILFATLSQYGYDETLWPQELREFYFDSGSLDEATLP